QTSVRMLSFSRDCDGVSAVSIQMDVLACESSFIGLRRVLRNRFSYFDGVPMFTSTRLLPVNHRPPNTNNAPTTRITKITRTATIPALAVLLPLSAISFSSCLFDRLEPHL